ncbi:conserved hypothetical protein [Ricinus communis]|uniref:Uncharacterized protein n=1 Tax=Ricinus communis TaxID=3988 RepID=B9S367_RICCO|nr:conserved hypothetical protein [Ricinus communis]
MTSTFVISLHWAAIDAIGQLYVHVATASIFSRSMEKMGASIEPIAENGSVSLILPHQMIY